MGLIEYEAFFVLWVAESQKLGVSLVFISFYFPTLLTRHSADLDSFNSTLIIPELQVPECKEITGLSISYPPSWDNLRLL